jgi:hypothetical protein
VKSIFGLNAEADYSKYRWKWWATPFVFVFLEIRSLLDCPFCIGYHLGWLICFFMWDFSLIESLIYGAITLIFVEIYRKATL